MDPERLKSFTALILVLATLVACNNEPTDEASKETMPPPEVGVITIEPRPLALMTELPGRLEASRVAEVRARAAGIVLRRVFEEGSLVKAGDVLYQIDPAPLQAELKI